MGGLRRPVPRATSPASPRTSWPARRATAGTLRLVRRAPGRADRAPVLDLACGSAPAGRPARRDRRSRAGAMGGIDLGTSAEAAGRSPGAGPRTRWCGARPPPSPCRRRRWSVVCAMGLQVVEPLAEAWASWTGCWPPGAASSCCSRRHGRYRAGDAWTYLRLQVALRQVIRYPNGPDLSPRRLAGDARGPRPGRHLRRGGPVRPAPARRRGRRPAGPLAVPARHPDPSAGGGGDGWWRAGSARDRHPAAAGGAGADRDGPGLS